MQDYVSITTNESSQIQTLPGLRPASFCLNVGSFVFGQRWLRFSL
jgi:hypothetical protein